MLLLLFLDSPAAAAAAGSFYFAVVSRLAFLAHQHTRNKRGRSSAAGRIVVPRAALALFVLGLTGPQHVYIYVFVYVYTDFVDTYIHVKVVV